MQILEIILYPHTFESFPFKSTNDPDLGTQIVKEATVYIKDAIFSIFLGQERGNLGNIHIFLDDYVM